MNENWHEYGQVAAGGLLILATVASVAALDHGWLLGLRSRERHRLAHRPPRAATDAGGWVDLALGAVPLAAWLAAAWLALTVAPWRGLAATGGLLLAGAVVLRVLACWLHRWAGPTNWAQRALAGTALGLRPLLAPPARAAEAWLATGAAPQAEEDLADAIEAGAQQGELSLVQSELLRRELSLARRFAADVMVPRTAVTYLSLDLSVSAAVERIVGSSYSRFPVERESVDDVVAVLHARDLLPSTGERPDTLRKLLALRRPRPPVHVASDQPLDEVLATLRRERASLALVDDAHGGVAGILTMEDVLEELVGEIVDESDRGAWRESVTCGGGRRLEELAEQGLELPGEPEQTLAQFLAHALGPALAFGAVWQHGPLRLTVTAVDVDGAVETAQAEWTAGDERPEARP